MPESLQPTEQAIEYFDTEESCVEHIIRMKWPNGFHCPRCNHTGCYRIGTRRMPLFQCAQCRYQASPISGTVMEGSRTPLRKWFIALQYMTRLSPGTSAMFLSRTIGVTYKTAWLMLHKIRHAIGQQDAETQLCGFVHVDKASYARPQLTGLSPHPREVPLLVAASSPKFDQADYVKIKIVPPQEAPIGINRNTVAWFKGQHVHDDATLLSTVGKYTNISDKRALPFHKMAVKWINTTFHGLGKRHLQAYLNEFCFLIGNQLRNSHPFESVIRLCGASRTITYRTLTRAAG